MKQIRLYAVAIFALALAACGGKAVKPTDLDPERLKQQWLAQQQQLEQLDTWSIKGKAAIRSEQDSGTVSLFWEQAPDNFRIKFIAPFGRGTLDIQSDERGVKMIDAKGREHRAATAKGLVWLKTGWEIPFDSLEHWAKGLTLDPSNPTIRVNAQGLTQSFESNGWHVTYPAYQPVNTPQGEIMLPRKVYVQSEGLTVKLALSRWQFEP